MPRLFIAALVCAHGLFAAQEVLIDQDLTYELTTGRINIDFSGKTLTWNTGFAYRRVKVLEKPSDYSTGIQICVWSGGETCSPCAEFSDTGNFYVKTEPAHWWGAAATVTWSVHGTRGYCLKSTGCGGKWVSTSTNSWCMGPSAAEHLPIKVHLTEILVPYDEEFQCPGDWVEGPWEGCPSSASSTRHQTKQGSGFSLVRQSANTIKVSALEPTRVALFTVRGDRVALPAHARNGMTVFDVSTLAPGIVVVVAGGRAERVQVLRYSR
jgi:hypothetical protein